MTVSQDQPWTVLRLLEWTTDYFKKKGSSSARLDAEILLATARGCERIELYTAFAEVPDDQQRGAFRELVRRRGEGTPVAHLVGHREFYSLRFKVDEHVLIPRPETEHVVLEALDRAKAMNVVGRPLRIADVGTGSGAIAIALAKHLPGAEIVAIDSSREALAVAEENARHHGVESRVQLVEGDLLENLDRSTTFDIVCSNPPYVSESEYGSLSPEVRDFEPRSALVAGPEGTEVIRRLLDSAASRIEPGGRLILELSPMIAATCLRLGESHPDWADPTLIKDLAGHQRVLSAGRR